MLNSFTHSSHIQYCDAAQ